MNISEIIKGSAGKCVAEPFHYSLFLMAYFGRRAVLASAAAVAGAFAVFPISDHFSDNAYDYRKDDQPDNYS